MAPLPRGPLVVVFVVVLFREQPPEKLLCRRSHARKDGFLLAPVGEEKEPGADCRGGDGRDASDSPLEARGRLSREGGLGRGHAERKEEKEAEERRRSKERVGSMMPELSRRLPLYFFSPSSLSLSRPLYEPETPKVRSCDRTEYYAGTSARLESAESGRKRTKVIERGQNNKTIFFPFLLLDANTLFFDDRLDPIRLFQLRRSPPFSLLFSLFHLPRDESQVRSFVECSRARERERARERQRERDRERET